jgi:protein ImuB
MNSFLDVIPGERSETRDPATLPKSRWIPDNACGVSGTTNNLPFPQPRQDKLWLCVHLPPPAAEPDNPPRDAVADGRTLNALATAACKFSGEVSLQGTDSIVLEIRSSLKLFGGLSQLLQRAEREFRALGVRFVFGIATTAQAAAWLARYRPGSRVLFAEQLPAALRELPIEALVGEEKQREQLQRSGVRRIADLVRLPRAGVARRFGPQLLRRLDRALGNEAELLDRFAVPAVFRAGEELCPPVGDWTQLEGLAHKLLQQLENYLLRRQAATPVLHCLLWHRRAPATVIRVAVSRPDRRAAVFLSLLREQFGRSALPEEVVGLGIYCAEIQVLPAETLHLLDGRAKLRQHWLEFTDRLAARLGRGRLSHPAPRSDHRPERENRSESEAPRPRSARLARSREEREKVPGAARPAWLLPQPAPLRFVDQRLHWNGPLILSRVPERIEQGWWDGGDVRRDYYEARNPAGTRLWVYCDRRERRWYLHGIFS